VGVAIREEMTPEGATLYINTKLHGAFSA